MIILFVLIVALPNILCNACIPRKTDSGVFCVCNSTYCDTVPSIGTVFRGEFRLISTTKSKLGFHSDTGSFSSKTDKVQPNVLKVNRHKKYQTVIGFGGAFTDATGINIKSLPLGAQEKLLESYFGKSGIEYTLCRVPIGGSDFSLRPYSYDDEPNDIFLKNFKLQGEDHTYKIPFIKRAIEMRNNGTFNLFASAWTAPPWMKTNNLWTGYGFLKKKYYQLWADYAVKFFEKYDLEGLAFWGMTTGNEPVNGFYKPDKNLINSMGWSPVMMREWIGEYLGPTIRKSTYKDLKIIVHDENRLTVPYTLPVLLEDTKALEYIDGVGIHWYTSDTVSPLVLNDFAQTDKKDIFWISTESCHFLLGVDLGNWTRAALYLDDIFDNFEIGLAGWVDWNMALNLPGGPTYIDYLADSPIIVNKAAEEFYKQPMYYALGHFSKFVIPDSVRIDVSNFISQDDTDVRTMAFLRPDQLVALIIFNRAASNVPLHVEDEALNTASIEIEPYSINTFLFSSKDC